MFNIGGSEMIVLGILALLVFGPEGLPGIIKTVMRTVNAVKTAARDFQTEVSTALIDENERQDLTKRQRKPFVDPDEPKPALPPSQQIGVAAVPAESPVDEPGSIEPIDPEDSEPDRSEVVDDPEIPEVMMADAAEASDPVDDDGPEEQAVAPDEPVAEIDDNVASTNNPKADESSEDYDGPGIPMKPVRPQVSVEEASEVS